MTRAWARWLLMSLAGLAVIYAAVIALLTARQDQFFYYPDPRPADLASAGLPGFSAVALETGDHERIRGWWSPPRGAAGVVVYLHGNGGNIGLRAARFRDLAATGAGVLAIDYRGYGGSSGHPTEDGLYEDARTAWRFVGQQAPGRPVMLFGESLGTGVTVQLATEVDEAGVVLDSPFSSLAGVVGRRAPWYPVRLVRPRYDSLTKIARIGSPLVILECDEDRVVPFAEAEKLFAAAHEPKRFVPLHGCGHIQTWRSAGRAAALDLVRAALVPANRTPLGNPRA